MPHVKNSDKNIVSLLTNKIEMYFTVTMFDNSPVNNNYDTLFLLKNVYPKNENLNAITNEMSDKVTSIIHQYKLSYILHGIQK